MIKKIFESVFDLLQYNSALFYLITVSSEYYLMIKYYLPIFAILIKINWFIYINCIPNDSKLNDEHNGIHIFNIALK